MSKIFNKIIIDSLTNVPTNKSIDRVRKLVKQISGDFDIKIGDIISDAILSFSNSDSKILWQSNALTKIHSPIAHYIVARCAYLSRNYEIALKNIEEAINLFSQPSPDLLLIRSKVLIQYDKIDEAAIDLKFALSFQPEYDFFIRSEKLLEKILSSKKWKPKRTLRLAILSSSTTVFTVSIIKAMCFAKGIRVQIYEGLYGNYQQEILDTDSDLYNFSPEIVVLIINHKDLNLSPTVDEMLLEDVGSTIHNLWDTIKSRIQCHLIQIGYDLPTNGAWGELEYCTHNGRIRILEQINNSLIENLSDGISFLASDDVSRSFGGEYFSVKDWNKNKQYPSFKALPGFADRIASHISAVCGISAKVLVLDLDNTLWGGIVGEEGVSNITIGPPDPVGEGFVEIQLFAKELSQRGILLAVCSKNNIKDAEEPFIIRDEMILGLDDFVIFTANWKDKATNLIEMANTLSLGLDSFVFIDDNPTERDWIRKRLPEVIVPECGSNPWSILNVLKKGRFFDTVNVTKEDLARTQSYKGNIQREKFRENTVSLEDFLSSLNMESEYGPINESTFTRVTQLINKTNQFNLTTRRYSKEKVKVISGSSSWWCRWFRLRDSFGDNGIIGVLFVQSENNEWHIDTWLMSCRVLGRKMETFMFNKLIESAKELRIEKITGEYIPTEKNILVKNHYSEFGFTKLSNNHPHLYSLHVQESNKLDSFIKDSNQEMMLN